MISRARTGLALSLSFSLAACGGSSRPPAPECTVATTCPAAPSPCVVATCEAGRCGLSPVAAGVFVDGAADGDCTKHVCDGAGAIVTAADDGDVPVDGNACTQDLCDAGLPSNPPEPADTPCAQGGLAWRCDGAGTCVECNSDADCTSGVCSSHACQPATCFDHVRNGPETDVDCGGTCIACGDGRSCAVPADCVSKVCSGSVCIAASCVDGVKNGGEADVDCGGPCAVKCVAGETCGSSSDCTSGFCSSGLCRALVVSTSPADGATGVATNTNVRVTFDEPILAGSFALPSDTTCTGTIQLSADGWTTCVPFAAAAQVGPNEIAFPPAQPLAAATAYRLRVVPGGRFAPYTMPSGFVTGP